MDNITHSLTGALAAKVIERQGVPEADQRKRRRVLFWLLVLCANLPDIDVLFSVFGGRLFSLQHHRGITHSFVFAPLFALLPATLFYTFGKLRDFKVVWLAAFLGIVIHIFFDLVTPFGTEIFMPFSTARYSLDWMFIIDPVFTALLGLPLLFGKIFQRQRRVIALGGGILVILYLSVEMISHTLAYDRMERELRDKKITAVKISALPQPLSVFRWIGLAQTKDGVMQTFFSVFGDTDSLSFTTYENPTDEFVLRALQTNTGKWYTTFARHPWIRSFEEGNHHVVEFRDLQFSIDRAIMSSVGFHERSLPFVLRFEFSSVGELSETTFDGRSISQK
ncbi:MAG: metal-dependent hydrolase [Bacteroidota bacterium]